MTTSTNFHLPILTASRSHMHRFALSEPLGHLAGSVLGLTVSKKSKGRSQALCLASAGLIRETRALLARWPHPVPVSGSILNAGLLEANMGDQGDF